MKKNLFLSTAFTLLLLFSSCNKQVIEQETRIENTPPTAESDTSQETLLDFKPVIIDSLFTEIPDVPRLCDSFTGEKMKVDIGDCSLYVEIEGGGVPLVLINGGPGASHHCFHPHLSAAKDYFKVIYYDQRGCGLSDYNPGEGYCFEQTIDDLDKLRQALNIDKWVVAGHSYGGAITQYYTVKYPENTLGMVLFGSVSMSPLEDNSTRQDDYMTEAELAKKAKILTALRNGEVDIAGYYYNVNINGGWKRQNFVKPTMERMAQWSTYYLDADPALTTDWGSYILDDVLMECPVPTLIAEGRYDLIWAEIKADVMKSYLPNADFVWFEKSGHDIFSDEPEAFVQALIKWAKTIQPVDESRLLEWKKSSHELLKDRLSVIEERKAFTKMIGEKGVSEAVKYYDEYKQTNPDKRLFFEAQMNALGYQLLFADKMEDAIELFKLNVAEYPESWNVYDSLGEAYLKVGDKVNAKINYSKSVELNPESEGGKAVIEELNKE